MTEEPMPSIEEIIAETGADPNGVDEGTDAVPEEEEPEVEVDG